MSYFILRNGQQYGPYSPADLRRYLVHGNILLSDLSRTEHMDQWVLLSQIVNDAAAPDAMATESSVCLEESTGGSEPTAVLPPPMPRTWFVPFPPRLHWAVLLFLVVATLGFFGMIWSIQIARWVRKIDCSSKGVLQTSLASVLGCVALLLAIAGRGTAALGFLLLLTLGAAVLFITAIFSMRRSVINHYGSTGKIQLRISEPMTLFFSVVYFQYKFNRLLDAECTWSPDTYRGEFADHRASSKTDARETSIPIHR